MFRMLIAHGAKINTPGPEGNVLEYAWKQAHTELPGRPESGPYKRREDFSEIIKTCIQMGATSSIRDPNGLVPSRARMLAVAKTNGPSVKDKRYYFHGACSEAKDEAACHRFVCRSMLSQVQRYSGAKIPNQAWRMSMTGSLSTGSGGSGCQPR